MPESPPRCRGLRGDIKQRSQNSGSNATLMRACSGLAGRKPYRRGPSQFHMKRVSIENLLAMNFTAQMLYYY